MYMHRREKKVLSRTEAMEFRFFRLLFATMGHALE
jgi:hypothetical protein